MDCDRNKSAFTLIELLVVVAIIVILIAILLPALRYARNSARMVREMSAGHQLVLAYLAYAEDNKGALMYGTYKDEQIDINNPPAPGKLFVPDNQGRGLDPKTGARYPWRIAPYFGPWDFSGMMDGTLFQDYSRREDLPDVATNKSRQYCLSRNPWFGMNSLFVGGSHASVKFQYSTRKRENIAYLHEVRDATVLMIFASARGAVADNLDPDANNQTTGANAVPGNTEVFPPRDVFDEWGWDNVNVAWNPTRPVGEFGLLDLRYGRKAITMQFDAHAELNGLKVGTRAGLRDMRRWYNKALGPNAGWIQSSGGGPFGATKRFVQDVDNPD